MSQKAVIHMYNIVQENVSCFPVEICQPHYHTLTTTDFHCDMPQSWLLYPYLLRDFYNEQVTPSLPQALMLTNCTNNNCDTGPPNCVNVVNVLKTVGFVVR